MEILEEGKGQDRKFKSRYLVESDLPQVVSIGLPASRLRFTVNWKLLSPQWSIPGSSVTCCPLKGGQNGKHRKMPGRSHKVLLRVLLVILLLH